MIPIGLLHRLNRGASQVMPGGVKAVAKLRALSRRVQVALRLR